MSLLDSIHQIEHLVVSIHQELPKVKKRNKAAAQRVRVATLQLERIGKVFRRESLLAEKTGKMGRKKKKPARNGSRKKK